MNNQEPKKNTYRVKLGHTEVTVLARTAAEAIENARQQLATEMPRFYDVISSLAPTRFEVQDAA